MVKSNLAGAYALIPLKELSIYDTPYGPTYLSLVSFGQAKISSFHARSNGLKKSSK